LKLQKQNEEYLKSINKIEIDSKSKNVLTVKMYKMHFRRDTNLQTG